MRYVVVATVQGTNATIIFVHSLRREPRHLDATASRNAMSENAYTMAKKNIQKSSSTKTKNSSNALIGGSSSASSSTEVGASSRSTLRTTGLFPT